MGQEHLKKFDRYFLLDCIAQGGMAEIFRARPAEAGAAGRLLVVKRILAGFGKNKDFVQMFKSEIQVLMRFNHPNITQLYEYGEFSNQPYIAMEFVDGKNLRQILQRHAERKQAFPVEAACMILEEAASGLHYAHTLKDKLTGAPLSIVHRDISPQNLLVSYDGNVKVIDFGIAKATTNAEATRVGVIKGKPSYLSPEQIAGEVLDGRSDVFSLGTVLWEALTGKKLFSAAQGENEFAVLRLIESCDSVVKPPSKLNTAVPPELDVIVMKALTKDRERRYQSAEEMGRALHRFLFTRYPDYSSSELSKHIKTLFSEDIVEDRKLLQKLNAKVEALLGSDGTPSSLGLHAPEEETDTQVNKKQAVDGLNAIPMSSKKDGAPVSLDIARLDGARVGGVASKPSSAPASAHRNMQRLEVEKRETKSVIYEDGNGMSTLVRWASLGAAAAATYFIGFPMYQEWRNQMLKPPFTQDPIALVPQASTTSKPQLSKGKILLKFRSEFPLQGSRITVNGQSVSVESQSIEVGLDTPLEISVEGPSLKPFNRTTSLTSKDYNGLRETEMDLPLEPVAYGYLTITTTPSAQVTIRPVDPRTRTPASEGRAWVMNTPIEGRKFPAGLYEMTFENKVLGMSKRVVVEVRDQISERREVKLEMGGVQ
jgi:serine/threonine-protein kinase